MGFKLPGKSIQSGTNGHRSALKMVAEQRAASALKKEIKVNTEDSIIFAQDKLKQEMDDLSRKNDITPSDKRKENEDLVKEMDELSRKNDITPESDKIKENEEEIPVETPEKKSDVKRSQKAYGGDISWETAQKQSKESGGDLNQTTRDQKAYEKQKKAENKDWNKREDNQWKKRQNTINAAVGSTKVYPTDSKTEVIKDEGTKERVEVVKKGEEKMAKKDPTEKVKYKKSDGTEVTEEKGGYKPAYKTEKKLVKSQQKEDKEVSKENIKSTEKGSEKRKEAKTSDKELRAKQERERRQMKRDQKANKLNEKASEEGASNRTKRRAKKATEKADELASRKDYKKTRWNPFD